MCTEENRMIGIDFEFRFAFKIHQYHRTLQFILDSNPLSVIYQIGQAKSFIQKQHLNIKCSAGQFVRTTHHYTHYTCSIQVPISGGYKANCRWTLVMQAAEKCSVETKHCILTTELMSMKLILFFNLVA